MKKKNDTTIANQSVAMHDDPSKIKIVGKRSGLIAPTLENVEILLLMMRQLRGGKGICPRGVYRFKTFEEADEWMMQMIVKSSRARQRGRESWLLSPASQNHSRPFSPA